MSKRFTFVTVGLSAAVSFLVGLIIAGGLTPAPIVSTAPRLAPRAAGMARPAGLPSAPAVVNFADVAERINAAVVNIDSTSKATDSRDPQRYFRRGDGPIEGPGPRDLETPRQGAGSGFLIDRDGYILTNHHVIANADDITVTLLENRSLTARVVGSDEGSDLAVLQVEAQNLRTIPFGDSASLRVGDYVVAVGNPFGFSNTVTSGIVSALGRSGLNDGSYESFIQTDASINPGNSGGALVNLNGELVGINSAIISRTGGNVGIGFAIPVSMVRAVMQQLIATGTVRRGLLGVNIRDVTPEIAATFALPDNSGALVYKVNEDSAAERADIRIDDIIVSINGRRLRDSGSLRSAIGLLPPGELVKVGVLRDGREQVLTAELQELEPAVAVTAAPPREDIFELDTVFEGADLVDNSTSAAALLVSRCDPGSPAFLRGLRSGDVITKVNRVRVRTLAEAVPIMEDARAILLEIQRGNRSQLILMR
jgi:Do/DeqQ family serine protease